MYCYQRIAHFVASKSVLCIYRDSFYGVLYLECPLIEIPLYYILDVLCSMHTTMHDIDYEYLCSLMKQFINLSVDV